MSESTNLPPTDGSIVRFSDLKQKPLQTENKPWHKTPKAKNGLTCYHSSVLIDRNMAYVECEDCGEHLNPMNVLNRLATEENRFEQRRKDMEAERLAWDAKSKTKCRHCGKMTELRPA